MKDEAEIFRELTEIAFGEPSAANWSRLCDLLAPLKDQYLTRALAIVRARILRWPADLRHISPWTPETDWVERLFAGDFDPRLELVGHAYVEHKHDFENPDLCGPGSYEENIYPIVKIFARALDPSFNPPDTVLSKENEYTAAAGCGGGFDSEKRGNDKQGMVWYDKIDESPSGNDPSTGDWSPYGLTGGYELQIGRHIQYQGYYTFSVTGQTPKVFELASAWGTLLRSGKVTPELASHVLSNSRDFFQHFPRAVSPNQIIPVAPAQSDPLPAAQEEKTLNVAQIVAAAAAIASPDPAVVDKAVSVVFKALDQFGGEEKKYKAALKAIAKKYPHEPAIQKFVVNAQKAHDEVMSKVYQKIINPLSGTPCCPQCKSPNIAEDGGVYEFTLMKCGNCGYEQMCDIYQQGDWYV